MASSGISNACTACERPDRYPGKTDTMTTMTTFAATSAVPQPSPMPDASWSRQATLFIHIPKTGGTTLDAIFRDHYFDAPLLPSTPFDLFGKYIDKFNDPSYPYIGGHYPISTIDIARFDRKITVLRDPVASISSGISYINKLNGVPQEALTDTEKSGLPALSYKKFFTTHFDTERYLIDLGYDVAKGMRNYLFDCAASAAVENIRRFTHVFDFEHFDGEVKRFIIEQRYFPYAEIGKKRQYAYRPDHARARPLLSEFDDQFHRLSTALLKKVPGNIDILYEQYREEYCKYRGLALRVHEGRRLDLRMPLGMGWHHVERSGPDACFRWSEPDAATIEIPVAAAGLYAVYLYVIPADVKNLQISMSTTLHPRRFEATLVNENNIVIYQSFVFTRAHDWIRVAIDMPDSAGAPSRTDSIDVRERGIILGNVYICRHPA